MRTADFDFVVPLRLIAQNPASRRDASRLLVLHRGNGKTEHRTFVDLLEYVQAGDVLVLNDSRVIAARLRGLNANTAGQFELLLLEQSASNEWWAMVKPGKRAREGTRIRLLDAQGEATAIEATVLQKNSEGHVQVRFTGVENIVEALDQLGEVPLPPYIERHGPAELQFDKERYQTIFAKPPGSVAAPTAGLHFTGELLRRIELAGVQVCFVTLHVGLGTFAPVKSENVATHRMHEERYSVSASTAEAINSAKQRGGRVIAVGTTTVRVLETIAERTGGPLEAGAGCTRIFIYPPYKFKTVDALLTNFHLPRSTLIMLVSAFAAPGRTEGRKQILQAYEEAVRMEYRFFSYGDAMLIV
jgi:S-adenosylmethionine:tRNA ribosyltransferase-isomerase